MTALAVLSGNKFHLSLNVSNLERAIAFYRVLFDIGPAKHYPDYAKFEVAEPAVIFSLVPHRPSSGSAMGHLGFRLADVASVQAIDNRLKTAGLKTQTQECTRPAVTPSSTACGSATPTATSGRSTPSPGTWTRRSARASTAPRPRCRPRPAPVVWEHFATHPVPERRTARRRFGGQGPLTGSFNLVEDEPARLSW